jgi:hypothetical protein
MAGIGSFGGKCAGTSIGYGVSVGKTRTFTGEGVNDGPGGKAGMPEKGNVTKNLHEATGDCGRERRIEIMSPSGEAAGVRYVEWETVGGNMGCPLRAKRFESRAMDGGSMER